MKILITNHQLSNYAGTEVFVYTLAERLSQKAHQVAIYSAYIGDVRKIFEDIGVLVTDNLKALSEDFDIAHVHHNINAYEIRNHYPKLPIVYMAHGIRDPLEHLPLTNLGISKFLAGSEGILEHALKTGIPAERLEVFHNPVDERKFRPSEPIRATPARALVISNKIDEITEHTIRQACTELNIECQFIGARFGFVPNDQLFGVINQADIVFSLGRGVIEAMMCGRVPIVFDIYGGDGMVTPENFGEIIKRNFSGKRYNRTFNVNELVEEIKLYSQEYGAQLSALALAEFSAEKQISRLESIYEECAREEVPEISVEDSLLIQSVCEMINQTRIFTSRFAEANAREVMISELGGVKTYAVFQALGNLRYKLFPEHSKGTKVFQRLTRRNKSRNS